MIVGVPKEIKEGEFRVAMTPGGANALVADGHKVLVQCGAGAGSGIADDEYRKAGAELVAEPQTLYERAELLMKVKEPLPSEYPMLRRGQMLFTYLHLASSEELIRALLDAGIIGIAYETVQTADFRLPLLEPMSEVAGKMASQLAAQYLQKHYGGRGVLMGGVTGVKPAEVVVLGCGFVGANAVKVAAGMGARVSAFDINTLRLAYLDDTYGSAVTSLYSNSWVVADAVARADIVIGAVLLPGARAPWAITEEMIKSMRPGTVIVDVAIDQGGCVENIRPTTHAEPIYVEHGVTHYAVTNIPAAVPRTATYALTNSTLSYARKLAALGAEKAMAEDPALALGLNLADGLIKHDAVHEAFPHLA
ncbi:MAG: alanine dehydrogenase [candidate division WS1 bacterium]|jgi:alanine dehydrogenase|nr:alanine dehydrogenase [candidate division WS1 bacterium]